MPLLPRRRPEKSITGQTQPPGRLTFGKRRIFDSRPRRLYDCAPMSSPMPDLADPWRLAELRKAFEGRLEPAALTRLAEAVEGIEECVDYALRFGKNEAGRATVEGHVRAHLIMRCQRCMEPLAVAVDSLFRLGVVASEAEADQLPEDLDPLLVSDQPVRLLDLLEDELLLCLPLVPMHREGECGGASLAAEDEPETKNDNPFAALAALKVKQSNDS